MVHAALPSDKSIRTADAAGVDHSRKHAIDEIALKKGHRDFVVVISAYINETLHVIGLLGGPCSQAHPRPRVSLERSSI